MLKKIISKGKNLATTVVNPKQCIKLSKEHASLPMDLIPLVSHSLDVFKLTGMSTKRHEDRTKDSTQFLTTLNAAIAGASNKENRNEAWLFFTGSVSDTPVLELQFVEKETLKPVTSHFLYLKETAPA